MERGSIRSEAISIDYIEIQVGDIEAAKVFYGGLFGWTFEDYGEDYTAFKHGAGAGGFARAEGIVRGGVLAVLYAEDLDALLADVKAAGGEVCQDIFEFPGGRRFHFIDPSGNELAIWSDDKQGAG